MDIRKLFIYLFIYFIFWIFWSFSKLDKNGGRVCWRCDREVTDPGEGSGGEWLTQGRGPGLPVIFRPNWDPKRGKIFFGDRPPLALIWGLNPTLYSQWSKSSTSNQSQTKSCLYHRRPFWSEWWNGKSMCKTPSLRGGWRRIRPDLLEPRN